MKISYDCRHYLGEKPCRFKRLCPDCPYYEPIGKRVLLIKLGALGDVLRTTSVLHGLRRKYPGCHITWVTDPRAVPLLDECPLIDRLYPYDLATLARLRVESFDLALNFDKEPRATALLMQVRTAEKLGFGMNDLGNLVSLNPETDYSLLLGLSDEIKFRQNAKTYQELCFESARLDYQRDEYAFAVSDERLEAARKRLRELGRKESDRLVGLNVGAGAVFATKCWTIEGFARLAELIAGVEGLRPVALGGQDEAERVRLIREQSHADILAPGTDFEIKDFAAIVAQCDAVVTSDTLAMHIAIALRVPVIALFGATCHQEVDLYGRGEKIVSTLPCAPCYKSHCDRMECMQEIEPEDVFAALRRVLGR